jgi:hypothetical protein
VHWQPGDLSAERVAKRTVKRYSGILGQWGSVALEDDKEGDASSHSFALLASAWRTSSLGLRESGSPGRQPWGSVSAVERSVGPGSHWDEMVSEAMCAYEYAPASEPKLTSSLEVLQAIKGINGRIPNRVLRHLPKRAITFLTKVFNTVLGRQYFPSEWKQAHVVSILKPGKDPALPSSYRPISIFDIVGKLFEKIVRTRVLREVSERGLLRDEQFGFPGCR